MLDDEPDPDKLSDSALEIQQSLAGKSNSLLIQDIREIEEIIGKAY